MYFDKSLEPGEGIIEKIAVYAASVIGVMMAMAWWFLHTLQDDRTVVAACIVALPVVVSSLVTEKRFYHPVTASVIMIAVGVFAVLAVLVGHVYAPADEYIWYASLALIGVLDLILAAISKEVSPDGMPFLARFMHLLPGINFITTELWFS